MSQSNRNVVLPKIRDLILMVGEDPDRPGLRHTPDRVIKAWKEIFSGYQQDPVKVLRGDVDGSFNNGVFKAPCKLDEIILLKGIEFYSTCEHHLLPFYGVAHIAYIPNELMVGLSKLARVLDVFARRMQIQENIGVQVTRLLDDELKCQGSACVLEAKHTCISCRGIQKQNCVTVTSSLSGVFRNAAPRQELFALIRS